MLTNSSALNRLNPHQRQYLPPPGLSSNLPKLNKWQLALTESPFDHKSIRDVRDMTTHKGMVSHNSGTGVAHMPPPHPPSLHTPTVAKDLTAERQLTNSNRALTTPLVATKLSQRSSLITSKRVLPPPDNPGAQLQ